MKNMRFIAVSCMLLAFAATAAEPELILSDDLVAKQSSDLYIVQMSEMPAIAYEGGMKGYKATRPGKGKKLNPNSAHVKKYVGMLDAGHDDALNSVGAAGNKIYDYHFTFNGFAAELTKRQVEQLKARGDVVRVWENEYLQLTTDTSPDFIGLTEGGEPWSKGYVGEDVIVGIIDTGIWPEHPSVADVPTPKKGNKGPSIPYGAPPADWSGDTCDFGNTAFNPNDADFECNDKLLGARFYHAGFPPEILCGAGLDCGWTEFLSARDNDGHGSHTATTAGGNNGVEASRGGEFLGLVSGMAPRARIAAYKVCWNGSIPPKPRGCASIDSMAAIDQAVADGVDVINFSIGGSSTNFNGPDDVAFLFAAANGVWVATSAGNAGPGAQTIGTPSGVPWITAVGAAQDDGVFGLAVTIHSPASVAGDKAALEGSSPVQLADTGVISADVELVDDGSGVTNDGCQALSNDLTGKVALVIRGACSFSTKYDTAAAAGASAIIVYNDGTSSSRIDPIVMSAPGTTIPGVMISFTDGAALAAEAGVTATLDPNNLVSRVNRIAGFSSRGPNGGAPDIIKPDIAAPGVAILAAGTPDGNDFQVQGELFQTISGTSMASPHVAGLFALLKEAHPDWTPAMARSAIMTTARQDLKKTFGDAAADPFDIGAGHIVPGDAFDPGLAYDADIFDYVRFTCGAELQPQIFTQGTCDAFGSIDSSDLNLPSIGVAALAGSQTVTRTVTSVANNNGNKSYTVSIDAPPGIDVSVSPSSFKLKRGQSATFDVTFTATSAAVLDEWTFGSLTWSHGGEYSVSNPIAIRPVAFSAPASAGGTGTDGSLSYDVQFGYDGDINATMDGLVEGEGQPDVVVDGGNTLHFFFVPPGTTLARFSLFDEEIGAQNDLDLQIQGPDTAGFPFVCFSGTGTSEEQCDLANPDPGFYAAFVIDFASDPGATGYTLWNFNMDGSDAGNTVITTPASAVLGTSGTVTVDWAGLNPGVRALGIISYDDGVNPLSGQTEVMINTQ